MIGKHNLYNTIRIDKCLVFLPGKYYWPGAESHEAYTDKPIIITSSTNKKIHPTTRLINWVRISFW